ncbi:MAG TPA: LD-carboxypeptidase, partial [Erythrobacter sp.]|nr:LD-carboxypeptidase [Erythrobacter sp.]
MVKIAICAPGKRLKRDRAEAVQALVAGREDVELMFHEQCFLEEGHFAGSDAVRLAALLDCANDPAFDAVWFAMGGYGSNRIAAEA